jgi:ABC-type branched-subunit amino acid transport system ATPase component
MLLELHDLSISFGGLKALNAVSLGVAKGSITGLIGPNGSGKTTLFNVVSGFYRPQAGHIQFDGRPITGAAPHAINQKGLARTFQGTRVFEKRTVLENILVALHSHSRGFLGILGLGSRAREDRIRAEAMLDWVGLSKERNETVSSLPVGKRHSLEIARSVAMDPKIILLDEPSAGLNPTEVVEQVDLIRDLQKKGITIFIIEHDMKLIMSICEAIHVLDMGQSVATGTPEEIGRNARVIECYLGKECQDAQGR